MKNKILIIKFLVFSLNLFSQKVTFEGKEYFQGRTEEKIIESGNDVVKIIMVDGSKIECFRKITSKSGLVTYTLNNIPITNIVYEIKTNPVPLKSNNSISSISEVGNNIKALFIYNFAKNIEWPQSKEDKDFNIGILGASPILKEKLEKVASKKKIGDKTIKIIEFNYQSVFTPVNLIYIDFNVYRTLTEKNFSPNTLFVWDNNPNFNSIMISLVEIDGKLKYAMNESNIEKSGLKASPQLRTMALNDHPITNAEEWKNIFDKLKNIAVGSETKVTLDKSDIFKVIEEQEKQVKEIETQKKELDEKIKSIYKQEEKIALQEKKLLLLEEQIKIKEQSLSVTNDEIAKQKETLVNTVNYIKKQKEELEKQKQDILNQSLVIGTKQEKITEQQNVLSKQKIVIVSFIGLSVLIFSLLFMVFRNLKQKKKDNKIITNQKALVEEKNREILDSIEYALRIQTAILPPQKIVKQYLENSFILYKPKDIVAGDFYWMENVVSSSMSHVSSSGQQPETINQQPNTILFAACDCTGHGVPGAMVSVVCHNALNRAVREFGLTQPAAILDKTAEIVIENFSKSEEDIKDGMDISLVSLKYSSQNSKVEIEWAGANNPLWIVRNAPSSPDSRPSPHLEETKADKQPIGMNDNRKPFTNHTFTLNSGDSIYLFTDGFADQFGGTGGQKKLTRKRFKDLISSLQDKSMQEQGIALDKFITEYRKEIEQIDDILVMGVRV